MKPRKDPRSESEKELQRKVVARFRSEGWLVEKTHGSMYQKGWPDLMCRHPSLGLIWVEMKRPGEQLRPSQVAKFRLWSKYGHRIWVFTGPQDFKKLRHKPNWWQYCGISF